jgi:hypothetical protein
MCACYEQDDSRADLHAHDLRPLAESQLTSHLMTVIRGKVALTRTCCNGRLMK